MAFPAHLQQDKTKKILEDLQAQLKSKPLTSITAGSNNLTSPIQAGDANVNSPARAALRVAQETSFGFFVSQDSAFGNLFLPVLPRFEGTPTSTATTTNSK